MVNKIEELTEGLEEVSASQINTVDGEEKILGSIGYVPSEKLPKLQLFAGKEMQEYLPIEEVIKIEEIYCKTPEEVFNRLEKSWANGVNEEYINYERNRLKL